MNKPKVATEGFLWIYLQGLNVYATLTEPPSTVSLQVTEYHIQIPECILSMTTAWAGGG